MDRLVEEFTGKPVEYKKSVPILPIPPISKNYGNTVVLGREAIIDDIAELHVGDQSIVIQHHIRECVNAMMLELLNQNLVEVQHFKDPMTLTTKVRVRLTVVNPRKNVTVPPPPQYIEDMIKYEEAKHRAAMYPLTPKSSTGIGGSKTEPSIDYKKMYDVFKRFTTKGSSTEGSR